MEGETSNPLSTSGPPAKRARIDKPTSSVENDIPSSAHYQISYAHRSIVTCACHSVKHDIVLTASQDGIVKFWKRTSVTSSSLASRKKNDGSNDKEEENKTGQCLEFIKSYVAHTAPLLALVNTLPDGDNAASVGEDNVIKFYDVPNFDVTGMIQANDQFTCGGSVAFVGEDQSLLAVSSKSTADSTASQKPGTIFIFSSITLSPNPVKEINLHAAPLTGMVYNSKHNCMISTDEVR